MSIVDDRGRLVGRVNLIDALVAVIILVLLPVSYGAYLLFRTPPPKLTGVFPNKLYQGRNLRVEITGANLRPFMRIAFNTIQGRTFMIGSPKYAQVDLPDLEPGAYDVQLFDYMREVDRLPKALTVLPMAPVPTVVMEVTGAFTGLSSEVVGQIRAGVKFPASGATTAEVLTVGVPVPGQLRVRSGAAIVPLPLPGQNELPATLRVTCFIAADPDGGLRCMVAGPVQSAPVAPDSVLTFQGPGGWVNFQVEKARAPSPEAKP
jgi:hypothetical protein